MLDGSLGGTFRLKGELESAAVQLADRSEHEGALAGGLAADPSSDRPDALQTGGESPLRRPVATLRSYRGFDKALGVCVVLQTFRALRALRRS